MQSSNFQKFTDVNWSEKRAVKRRPFFAKGWVRLEDGRKIAIKTFDGSALGLGITHEEGFPNAGMRPKGWLAIAGLEPSGQPYIFEAEVEVRHSVVTSDLIRSGLLFTKVSPDKQVLLTGLMLDRSF